MLTVLLFILFGGLAVGCAVSMVAQRNPLYSAISLVGVFVALACLYMTLAAPFIAAVPVIVYAGAIRVLVIFVIRLLNVEEEVRRPVRLRYLIPIAVGLASILIAETAFMLTMGGRARIDPRGPVTSDIGQTMSIGTGLFTEYLLPFEITSVLILMALVGAITLARRTAGTNARDRAAFGATPELIPAVETGRGGAGILQPGRTAATGQAMAEFQIEEGEASAPARKEEE
ncbi:MAG TPA: NADH-quinone oxidoreductase subunit J [Pyrinomonadaceae bacterium]|nr:NADH-quinone oxidoreductase subunit J [Pyrinomonadaceae bacterium]